MGSIGGFYFSRSDRKISTLKESCVACRCWPQIAGIQQFVGSAGFASLYTHSVDDGAYYDRCRCWTLKYGTGIYAVLSRRRTKDLQAHTAFGLLRAFAETNNLGGKAHFLYGHSWYTGCCRLVGGL